MAYEDWDPVLQEVFENAVASSDRELSEAEYADAEAFFEYGWVTMPGPTEEVRDIFFGLIDIDDEYFDWEAWREYWGYDES